MTSQSASRPLPTGMDMFTPMSSVKDRWPGLEDGELVDAAFEVYAVQRSAHIHFFSDADPPQPQVLPHADNNRALSRVIRKYATRH